MKTYIISYDFKQDDAVAYKKFYDYIKSFDAWAHINESVWAVITDYTASELRDYLVENICKKSSLLVLRSGQESAWKNVLCSNKWLLNNL